MTERHDSIVPTDMCIDPLMSYAVVKLLEILHKCLSVSNEAHITQARGIKDNLNRSRIRYSKARLCYIISVITSSTT